MPVSVVRAGWSGLPAGIALCVGYVLPWLAGGVAHVAPAFGALMALVVMVGLPVAVIAAGLLKRGRPDPLTQLAASLSQLDTAPGTTAVAMALWGLASVTGFLLGLSAAAHHGSVNGTILMVIIMLVASIGAHLTLLRRGRAE